MKILGAVPHFFAVSFLLMSHVLHAEEAHPHGLMLFSVSLHIELDGRVQSKIPDSVFRVDDWVILYLLFSLCRFELVCNALDKLPTSSHLEFPFAAVSPTDEFFIFPFLAISSFLFWFSSLLILFLLFVSFLKFSVCSFSFALLESSPRLCACWTSAWPLNCLPVL